MPQTDVLIVGAGLAGLCCAKRLHAAGVSFLVVEAASRPGGRVRTHSTGGFLLDRGFQVLLTSYPEVQSQLDLDALDPSIAPGVSARSPGGLHTTPITVVFGSASRMSKA